MLHLLAVCLWRRRTTKASLLATSTSDSAPPTSTQHVDTPGLPLWPNSNTLIKALYVTCSSPFPEVETFVESCAASYHLDLIRTMPNNIPMKEALNQYKEREPGVTSILVGTRRDDPHGGELRERLELAKTTFTCIFPKRN